MAVGHYKSLAGRRLSML